MDLPKENFLRLLNNDSPKWLGDPWDCVIESIIYRPLTWDAMTLSYDHPTPGEGIKKSAFGDYMNWPEGEPGAIPYVTPENVCVKNVIEWDKYITFPNIDEAPWAIADHILSESLKLPANQKYIRDTNRDLQGQLSQIREHKLMMVPMFVGPFEFSTRIMGFEEAFVNYLLEPEAVSDMLGAYIDWKIAAFDAIWEHWQPDIIHSHDDYGSRSSLFMQPETYREVIFPHVKRFYEHIKNYDVILMHHADCTISELVLDLCDMGVDIWQGAILDTDIRNAIEQTRGRITVMGGIDMHKIDFPDIEEEKIRSHVRDVIDTYMPLGHFIPCCTSVKPIFQRTADIMNDELNRYGEIYAEKHFNHSDSLPAREFYKKGVGHEH